LFVVDDVDDDDDAVIAFLIVGGEICFLLNRAAFTPSERGEELSNKCSPAWTFLFYCIV